MNTSFLSRVENRWNILRRSPGCGHIRSFITCPSTTELVIKIQTNEATATITARQAMNTLEVSVHRFKDRRILSEGSCRSDAELDHRLRRLCTELSVSPFA